MSDLIRTIRSPEEISTLAEDLRNAAAASEIKPCQVLDVFEAWAAALGEVETAEIPGVQFLRIWLRRGTLEPILARELGRDAICGGWSHDGRANLRPFPVGIVGHWPAGNIEIQPALSLTCALLGGNGSLVRVPEGLHEVTQLILGKLEQSDRARVLTPRVAMLAFDHARQDLQEAMARQVDGAMIWGGEEAVLQVRSLPFPYWARLAIFGPRISVAAMDAKSWLSNTEKEAWCTRIARDVWQFDQQACSSPHVLFLEKGVQDARPDFLPSLKRAFELENRMHPRQTIPISLTTAICQARASWLLDDVANRGIFPRSPDWSILVGHGTDMPEPTHGKTLTVLEVDDLLEPIQKLDRRVQTLGLAIADPARETRLASVAARKGVDRIVKLGRMHVFAPPWDGVDLIRPMVRMVRHVPSTA
jgi:hypothetical protein